MNIFKSRPRKIFEGDIKIHPVPEDQPGFKRRYLTTVGDGFKITVELQTRTWGRSDWSTLEQKGGSSIVFDANRVADKIIDRELYPLVQSAVDKILAIDKAYVASKPSEFIDEKGQTWRLA